MEERYSRSLGALTEAEITALQTKRVCVIGCGGIGGYAIELLARTGITYLSLVDGDCFDVSNLNRQLFCTEENIGCSKAAEAEKQAKRINSALQIHAYSVYINNENVDEILRGHDLVIDALDSISARRILERSCSVLGIPLIHAAISGWNAQIAVIMPETPLFNIIYPEKDSAETTPSLSFTPALAASIQVAEAVKLLVGRSAALSGRLLVIDLLSQEYNTIIF